MMKTIRQWEFSRGNTLFSGSSPVSAATIFLRALIPSHHPWPQCPVSSHHGLQPGLFLYSLRLCLPYSCDYDSTQKDHVKMKSDHVPNSSHLTKRKIQKLPLVRRGAGSASLNFSSLLSSHHRALTLSSFGWIASPSENHILNRVPLPYLGLYTFSYLLPVMVNFTCQRD